MKSIKVVTRVNEANKVKYSRDFQIMEKLPEVGDYIESIDHEVIEVKKAVVDVPELSHNSEAYGYSFYEVVADYKPNMDEDDYEPDVYYIAIADTEEA